ncbi:family 20 glycosylhydrolase [Actinotalea subterranea]|uniref:family 20 glycosylhydrolase n=1 Tax=Actinotalea subterranea TaxID=2607497 RepID=UPI0011EEA208|nr:family 20 glycosylhydrolase [Actinotalea subterranea]
MTEIPVIPAPLEAERRPGEPFVIGPGLRIVAGPEPDAVSTAILVAGRVGEAVGTPVAVVEEDDGSAGVIVLRLTADRTDVGLPADVDPRLADEAYRLEVSTERVVVTALAGAGLFRGVITLQQSSRPSGGGLYEVPPVHVVDHPRFSWRGLSVDLARHFFDLEQLRSVVDLMASYKLNVLHLHLTDDQGWRLEIPSRPELTAVSGTTAVGGDPGGWLTGQDYAAIVTHAASRFITVVPEIDIPGHVNAALHAYGELTPSGEPTREYTGTDVGFSRLHVDLPGTAPFLRDVLGDVAAMTPGAHVHIGGDEVLTMDAEEYRRLVHLAMAEVDAAGKVVVGWQEVATALVPDGAPADAAAPVVVQYWDEREGADDVTRAALAGADVLLSPASKVYLDMRYDASTPLGLDWAGHIEVRDSYEWEPLDVLPGVPRERVVGVEAAVWTETIRTSDDLFFLLLPRLAAVAEVAWSAPGRRGWESFAARVPAHVPRWETAGLVWYRSPQIDW